MCVGHRGLENRDVVARPVLYFTYSAREDISDDANFASGHGKRYAKLPQLSAELEESREERARKRRRKKGEESEEEEEEAEKEAVEGDEEEEEEEAAEDDEEEEDGEAGVQDEEGVAEVEVEEGVKDGGKSHDSKEQKGTAAAFAFHSRRRSRIGQAADTHMEADDQPSPAAASADGPASAAVAAATKPFALHRRAAPKRLKEYAAESAPVAIDVSPWSAACSASSVAVASAAAAAAAPAPLRSCLRKLAGRF